MTAVLPLAVTMGEPAGIGGEILLRAWLRRAELPPCYVIDDATRLIRLAQRLGLNVPVRVITEPAQAVALWSQALPVMDLAVVTPVEPGHPDSRNAGAVRQSVERAVEDVRRGRAAALITNPIHKKVMYDGGFPHPGHTEFLAELTGGTPVMMLTVPGLRVVPVTIHVAISEAVTTLTREKIQACGVVLEQALRRDFGISQPRIAVAALNPHAGEDGSMGAEEAKIIAPAVAALQAAGIAAFGPLPSDTMFHQRARGGYDAALCMYHDQALIPLKTIDFDRGVNVTLGLPVIRTSPDHGTAFDIAGRGMAREDSLVAAITVASEMAARRLHRG